MERKKHVIGLTGNVNEYIKGRVSGMIDGVTRNLSLGGYAILEYGQTTIFRFDATDEEFETVCEMILHYYGNMKSFVIEIVKF